MHREVPVLLDILLVRFDLPAVLCWLFVVDIVHSIIVVYILVKRDGKLKCETMSLLYIDIDIVYKQLFLSRHPVKKYHSKYNQSDSRELFVHAH